MSFWMRKTQEDQGLPKEKRQEISEKVRSLMEENDAALEHANQLVQDIVEVLGQFSPEEGRYAVKVITRTLERWMAFTAYNKAFGDREKRKGKG